MSGYIVGRLLWADLPAHLKLTAIAIGDAANSEGYAFPGIARIAAQIGQTERQVRYNIAELKARGILTVYTRGKLGGGRASNGYQIDIESLPVPPTTNRQPVSGMDGQTGNEFPVQTGNPAQANRKSSVGKPEIQRRKNAVTLGVVSGSENEPSVEPSDEPSVEHSPASRGSRLTLRELPKAWELWTLEKRPDLDPRETFDTFADFWRSKPGKDGLKSDWFATWRNWCRKERTPIGQHYRASPEPRGAAYRPLNFED